MDRQQTMRALFGTDRALIGCVHVAALPGTPKASLPIATIAKQAAALRRAFDALTRSADALERKAPGWIRP